MENGTYTILQANGMLNPEYIATRNEIDSTPMIYQENATISSITLPKGWTWVNGDTPLELGPAKHLANYKSSNPNYADVNNVELDVIILQAADYTELEEYLASMEDGIGYDNLVPTDYQNYDALKELVDSARAQKSQVDVDRIFVKIKAYRLKKTPIDTTAFEAYLEQVDTLVGTDYYNWEQFQEKLQEVEQQILVSAFEAKFEEAKLFVLQPRTVNQRELQTIREELDKLNKEDYTNESWQAIQDLLTEAANQKVQSEFDRVIDSIDFNTLVRKQVENIELVTVPKTSYVYGENIDVTGGTIRVNYDNGTSQVIDMKASWVTGFNNQLLNEVQKLTITYEGKTAIYNVTVKDYATGIRIQRPNKQVYQYGEELDLEGLTVMLQLKSGETTVVNTNECTITGYEKHTLGTQTITVTYQEYEPQAFQVRVDDYVTGIKVTPPTKRSYFTSDTRIVTTGMKVETIMASGNAGEDVTKNATVDNNIDFKTAGSKEVLVTYGKFEKTFIIVVVDTEKPVIALNGDKEVTIEVGTTYVDAGATAAATYGNITKQIKTVSTVNTSIVGDYRVTYNVADVTGKQADEVVRIVHVVDTTAPVITVDDDNNIYSIQINSEKPSFNASAEDNYTKDVEVVITDNINTAKVGTYFVTFTSEDEFGNKSTQIRTFEVVDTIAPVIKVTNRSEVVEVNTEFDPYVGVSVTDNSGEDITVEVELNNLDLTRLGTYVISYTAKDSTGNQAARVNKKITVKDSIAPEFKEFNAFKGDKSKELYIVVGSEFTDPGAVFTDNYNLEEELVIVTEGTVDTNTIGTYTITYTATDSSGNETTQIRTIHVTDEPPAIYMNDPASNGATIKLTGTTQENPKVFLYQPTIKYSEGKLTITRNGESYKMPADGKILEEGTYVMTVEGLDENGNLNKTKSTLYFIVDISAPEVIGFKSGKFTEAQTITFADVDDVASAVLKNTKTGEIVEDVRQYLINNNTNQYVTPSIPGSYTLTIADEYGNSISYKIIMQ